MITEPQKRIYNYYLRSFRINNNNPFRPKKKFDDLKEDKKNQLIKLEKFFIKFPHLFNADFFDAPYILYQDEKKYYGLDFYASNKGLSTCINYYKFLQQTNPDNQLDYIKNSLKFITNFCIEKNIPIDGYTSYRSVAQNDCLKHLKEHSISWYCVFFIPRFRDLLYDLPKDEFELYFGSDIDLNDMEQKLINSTDAKRILVEGIKKITTFVQKKLKY
jgi:hypothetical protein